MTVICALALLVVSATLTAVAVTGFGEGIAPGGKKIHLQRSVACKRLARIRTRHANLAHSRIASCNSIYVPIHACSGSSVDLRCQRDSMIGRQGCRRR